MSRSSLKPSATAACEWACRATWRWRWRRRRSSARPRWCSTRACTRRSSRTWSRVPAAPPSRGSMPWSGAACVRRSWTLWKRRRAGRLNLVRDSGRARERTSSIMTHSPENERILIFDFGAQYVQLIARRVREQNVFSQIVRFDLPAARVKELNPTGIILSGSPWSVYEKGAPHCDPEIFNLNVPILGLCYGLQIMCHQLGGHVKPGTTREFGRATVRVVAPDKLLAGVPDEMQVWMSHGDQVDRAGDDFTTLASTESCPLAAVKHKTRKVFGLQFHPEVSHTPQGSKIIRNFLYDICGCRGLWKMSSFVERTVAELRDRI